MRRILLDDGDDSSSSYQSREMTAESEEEQVNPAS